MTQRLISSEDDVILAHRPALPFQFGDQLLLFPDSRPKLLAV
jgi:hypothetical protein